MTRARFWKFDGTQATISVRTWDHEDPRYVAIVAHGYPEHAGRYGEVADRLVAHGAAVYAPDHLGFGLSEGERACVKDLEDIVTDVRTVAGRALAEHPGKPQIVIGHSVGGLIATRYAQRFPDALAALVLVAPVLGTWQTATMLLSFDELPTQAYDIGPMLSRDNQVGEDFNDDLLVWHGPFLRATLEAIARALTTANDAGDLGALPTLWLHGDADSLTRLEDTRTGIELIGGEELHQRRYRGAYHDLFHETNREQVFRDVTGFIDQAVPRG
ncbi:alpha/beta fold hydrolase [Micromonospora sp. WMMD882]|uniref:alpha/beta fold hydrolase n=1 Tax=Micromonospora sp. WMMD882 TaxID=3015151 RepID=UPI00248B13B3|nr:alpha/beta fold hydrolase [Micromonospora sp. WMMD882]WBB77323.1 alpha/beta fold hydrolase [Micromonospora sp. WMMD882]